MTQVWYAPRDLRIIVVQYILGLDRGLSFVQHVDAMIVVGSIEGVERKREVGPWSAFEGHHLTDVPVITRFPRAIRSNSDILGRSRNGS